jgi:hypothetical protein
LNWLEYESIPGDEFCILTQGVFSQAASDPFPLTLKSLVFKTWSVSEVASIFAIWPKNKNKNKADRFIFRQIVNMQFGKK